MSESCNMPTPGPEHERILRAVGRWNVDCTFFMGPESMRCRAEETIEAVGGFWTVSRFVSEFMGMPYVGRATTGYDPARGKYVASWIDSMSSHMFVMEGDFDAASRTMTMRSRGPDRQGGMTDYRMVTTYRDDDRFDFDMYMSTPGGEVHMFRHEYSRAS